jgi:hypothetical protein
MGLTVGIIDAAVPLGEPAPQHDQSLGRERDQGHGDFHLGGSYRDGGGRRCPLGLVTRTGGRRAIRARLIGTIPVVAILNIGILEHDRT